MSAPDAASSASERKPRKGDECEGLVAGFDHRGRAIGTSGSYTFETRGAVPGDRVRLRVLKRHRAHLRAAVLERLEDGPGRVAARCRHSGTCGGCSFQELDYAAQLAELRSALVAGFEAHGLLDGVSVGEVLGCAEPWRYRNKMEFTFGARRWIEEWEPQGARADFALGLHVAGRFEKVLQLSECAILFEGGQELLLTVGALVREFGLSLWNVHDHVGLMRFCVLRKGVNTGEVMVNLVTSSEEAATLDELARRLVLAHPEITTVVQNITTRRAAVSIGERERVLHGPGYIRDELLGVSYRISAGSFFQTNTKQAEELFRLVRAAARLEGGERVYDLYCGTGSISLLLAERAGSVVGYEEVESAVADARLNAHENGISNTRFVQGDVLALLREELGREERPPVPNLVVLDPPRAGLHPKLLPLLCELKAPRIVYVSCNPRAAAEDLRYLRVSGYRVESVEPVDLFPHTPHLECVIALQHADSAAARPLV